METFRYIVALLLVTLVPALCCYWLLLHGFLPFWRRLGISASQYLLWGAVLAVAILISTWRDVLLAGEYGFQPILATIGVDVEGAFTAYSPVEIGTRQFEHQTKERFVATVEGDANRVDRHACSIVDGAVNGIDDPKIVGIGCLVRLFAPKVDLRSKRGQSLRKEAFTRHIGFGDQVDLGGFGRWVWLIFE
jgi:hypothetical protein